MRHETREAYVVKKKSPFFRELPLAAVSLVDEVYERGYMPLVKLDHGYGWAYEKAAKMNPAKLIKTSDPAVIQREEGLGAAAKTIDKIIFDEDADFILISLSDDPQITVSQFKLGGMNTAINFLLGVYKHHQFR
jgi:hypothetical protein